MHTKICKILFLSFFLLVQGIMYGQCPRFFDSTDDFAEAPLWKNCTAGEYTLNIVSDVDLGPYTIDWGDGSNESGGGLLAGQSIFHNYPPGIANYTVVITVNGCSITGLLVSELPVKASIQVPPGGVTMVCAPGNIEFLNSSTGNSENTTYFWEFGDGETLGVLDDSNAGETISHTYQRGNVNCNTRVTLRAQNFCSTRPSEATFEPVQIWDLDDPAINVSDDLLCWPDNTVTYNNVTNRNCSQPEEGNTSQRFEYWRFIDFFGPGQDSIIDWRPWPPSQPRTISYPSVGVYQVELRDSSFCGVVSITRTIEIIDPPIAAVEADKDTVCLGEDVVISNLTGLPANVFRYNADDGQGWRNFGGNQNRTVLYNTPGTKRIRLAVDVANATNSCKDTAEVLVEVLPNPLADFEFPVDEACDALDVRFTNISVDGVSYAWDFGNGITSDEENPALQSYTQPGLYEISLEVRSAKNCPDIKINTLTIYASPEVDFEAPDTCAASDILFENTTFQDPNNPVTDWQWEFGDGTQSIARSPTKLYLNPGTYVVRLQAQGELCNGMFEKSIEIYDLPNAAFIPDPLVGCAPFDVTFTNNSTGANTFVWDLGDGSTSQAVNPTNNYSNNGTDAEDVNVQLKGINARGCVDSVSRIVVVNPEISADFNFTATNNCSSFSVQFQDASLGATNFFWDFGDGNSSTAQNPNHEYTNTSSFSTTVTVTFTASNDQGCSETIVKNISISPDANFGFTASPDSGCTPLNVTFTAKTGAVSYDWLFPDGSTASGVVVNKTFINNTTSPANKTVRLTATTADGCTDVQEQDIVVFPKPSANVSPNTMSGCSPLTVEFINNSVNGVNAQWLFGDGFGLDTSIVNVEHTYTNTTGNTEIFNAQVIIESAFSCKDTALLPIEVFSGIDVQINQALAGCSPFTQLFEATGGDSYQWDFGNGQTSVNASENITYVNNDPLNSRFFTVSLTAESASGCTASVTENVEVYPTPLADFISDVNSGCSPLIVEFTNQSVGANRFFWNIDGQASERNFNPFDTTLSNTGAQPSTKNAQLQVQNSDGCTAMVDKDIEVFPEVIADFVHDSVACSPFSVPFFNLSTNATTYQWDFGVVGLRSDINPRVTFTNSTTDTAFFPITMEARSSFGCTDIKISRVKVLPTPMADFNLSTLAACEPVSVTITNTSVAADIFDYDFGTGNKERISDAEFTRAFENPNAFVRQQQILLIATNSGGCVDSALKTITIFPRIEADFSPPGGGCSPLELDLQNRSQGFSSSKWDFNGEQIYTSTNVSHTFTNTGTSDEQKNIELVVENDFGCTDTAKFTVDVFALPKPKFDVAPSNEIRFPDASFTFSNSTDGTWNYRWMFGDASTSNQVDPAEKTYTTWGRYRVLLEAFDDQCTDTISQFVNIIPPLPLAEFNGGGEDCLPARMQFMDNSIYPVSWLWDFGDGSISTQQNPQHIYREVGTYNVTLTVTGPNGEDDIFTRSQIVTVHPRAEASFTYSPERAHLKDPVDFVNLSLNADRFQWDFGDGEISMEENPTHFYQSTGIYNVQLIADNPFGCPDTAVQTNAVDVFSGGSIAFPNAFTPSSEGSSDGGTVYNPRSIDNDVFFPLFKEIRAYNLRIFTRWGELIFETNDINVGWNGSINGQPAQQEVYVFKAKGFFEDGTPFEKVGDITLIR